MLNDGYQRAAETIRSLRSELAICRNALENISAENTSRTCQWLATDALNDANRIAAKRPPEPEAVEVVAVPVTRMGNETERLRMVEALAK